MPIPKSIANFNKHVTNKFFLLFAGRLSPFAIVNHKGRRSGRSYRTPILAFPMEAGFVFALTYGRDVDWRGTSSPRTAEPSGARATTYPSTAYGS